MIFIVGIAAAMVSGIGLVVQQRIASRIKSEQPLSVGLIVTLMRNGYWWLGTGLTVGAAALSGFALTLGPVSLVEALISTYLLWAFLASAVITRRSATWRELAGALLLSAALGVFIAVGQPQATDGRLPGLGPSLLAACLVGAVAFILVSIARRRRAVTETLLIATAVGVLYGLQDAGSRAMFVAFDTRGFGATLTTTPWPYIVVLSAGLGIVLAQSAFRAGRLDHALPPTAAMEPLAGVALGLGLLSDHLSVSIGALTVEALCVVAMLTGVVVIGRSPMLRHCHTTPVRA